MTRVLGLVDVLIHTRRILGVLGLVDGHDGDSKGTEPACGLPASLVPPMSAGSRTAGWGHFLLWCTPKKRRLTPRNTQFYGTGLRVGGSAAIQLALSLT